MTQRFTGYIHSIVGHQIMVSPNGSVGEQYKCALDDFESIMPTAAGGPSGQFTFHVKRGSIGVEHYRNWLGLAKVEVDRMANMERALLDLIGMVGTPAPVESPEAFGDRFFGKGDAA
jgi:hypothetical protein